jgi:hypothetical protein
MGRALSARRTRARAARRRAGDFGLRRVIPLRQLRNKRGPSILCCICNIKWNLIFYGEWTVRRARTSPFPEVRLQRLQLVEWLVIQTPDLADPSRNHAVELLGRIQQDIHHCLNPLQNSILRHCSRISSRLGDPMEGGIKIAPGLFCERASFNDGMNPAQVLPLSVLGA